MTDRVLSWRMTAVLFLMSLVWMLLVQSMFHFLAPVFISEAAYEAATFAFFNGLIGGLVHLPALQFGEATALFASIHWLSPTTWMYIIALTPAHLVAFSQIAALALDLARPPTGGATPDGE